MDIVLKVHDKTQDATYSAHFMCYQQNQDFELLGRAPSRGQCGVCGADFDEGAGYDDTQLLAVDYELLNMQESCAAISAAENEGRATARSDEEPFICDCAEPNMPHTCPKDATFNCATVDAETYLRAVLEVAHQADVIDMNSQRFKAKDWSIKDPRVSAFVKAAQDEYQSILDSMEYDEEAGWRNP